jgi:hypothetical protein
MNDIKIEIRYTLSQSAQRAELGAGRPAHRDRSVFVDPTPELAKIALVSVDGRAVIDMEHKYDGPPLAEEVLTPEKATEWVLLYDMKHTIERELARLKKEEQTAAIQSFLDVDPNLATNYQIDEAKKLEVELSGSDSHLAGLRRWIYTAKAIQAIDVVLNADRQALMLDPASDTADIIELSSSHECTTWDGSAYAVPELTEPRKSLWQRRENWLAARTAAQKRRQEEAKASIEREEAELEAAARAWLVEHGTCLNRPELVRAAGEGRKIRKALTKAIESRVTALVEEVGRVVQSYTDEPRSDVPTAEAYKCLDDVKTLLPTLTELAALPDAKVEVGPISRFDLSPRSNTTAWRTGVCVSVRHPWLTDDIDLHVLAAGEPPYTDDD